MFNKVRGAQQFALIVCENGASGNEYPNLGDIFYFSPGVWENIQGWKKIAEIYSSLY